MCAMIAQSMLQRMSYAENGAIRQLEEIETLLRTIDTGPFGLDLKAQIGANGFQSTK